MSMTPETMTKDERSIIVYAESCAVDRGGLMEGVRMNGEDLANLGRFEKAGLLASGRIPSEALTATNTHWVELTDAGWALAGLCRRYRARPECRGPHATKAFNALGDRV